MVARIASVVTAFIHVSEHSNARLNKSRKHILTTGQRLKQCRKQSSILVRARLVHSIGLDGITPYI